MAGMKVISFVDAEIAKQRQVAIADLEAMQRRLLDVIAALGTSVLKLADRVTALERPVDDIEAAIAGLGERVKALEQRTG